MSTIAATQFSYLSCNFHHERNGIPGYLVLNNYHLLERNRKMLAFIGIITPETLTSTTLVYFQDEDGHYIYGLMDNEDGSALYTAVQKAINQAAAAGTDYIITLGDLGVDFSSSPWTNREVI